MRLLPPPSEARPVSVHTSILWIINGSPEDWDSVPEIQDQSQEFDRGPHSLFDNLIVSLNEATVSY